MAWAPDYCTSVALAAYRNVDDSNDDAWMSLAVTAASRAVDRFCNRQFGSAAQTRYYSAEWDGELRRWVVDVDDICDTDGLTITFDSSGDGSYSSTVTAYDLTPRNAEADGKPWTRVVVRDTSTVALTTRFDGVKVTATFGWAEVPDTVQNATLLQASRFLVRRDAVFGIAGGGDFALRLQDKVDPDVAAMLRPYRRMWGAA